LIIPSFSISGDLPVTWLPHNIDNLLFCHPHFDLVCFAPYASASNNEKTDQYSTKAPKYKFFPLHKTPLCGLCRIFQCSFPQGNALFLIFN
jgi:hypothetical protein